MIYPRGTTLRTAWRLPPAIARIAALAGISVMVLCGLGTNVTTHAADQRPARYSEYLVKAAFLYNFARFTQWPSGTYASPSAPFTICVLGKDPFGDKLDSISGKLIRGRPLAIQRIARVEESRQCQIVFIGEEINQPLAPIIRHLSGRPILTVCNAPKCELFNGMIHFKVVSEKIRFIIDKECAKTAGLKLSSKLLALAEQFASRTRPRILGDSHRADASASQGQLSQLSRR